MTLRKKKKEGQRDKDGHSVTAWFRAACVTFIFLLTVTDLCVPQKEFRITASYVILYTDPFLSHYSLISDTFQGDSTHWWRICTLEGSSNITPIFIYVNGSNSGAFFFFLFFLTTGYKPGAMRILEISYIYRIVLCGQSMKVVGKLCDTSAKIVTVGKSVNK